MAYRKLGRTTKHRRSMLANITIDLLMNESVVTTETRAKEVRKFAEKMITYCKKGDLVGVKGHIQTRKYEDADEVIHNVTEVIAEKVTFLSSKKAD